MRAGSKFASIDGSILKSSGTAPIVNSAGTRAASGASLAGSITHPQSTQRVIVRPGSRSSTPVTSPPAECPVPTAGRRVSSGWPLLAANSFSPSSSPLASDWCRLFAFCTFGMFMATWAK